MAGDERGLLRLVCFFLVSLHRAHLADSSLSEEPRSAQPDTSYADVVPNDEYRHLMHFVQVTDTHLSVSAPERTAELKELISDVIMEVIKPPVVVMSGDIVDSLRSRFIDTGQILEEWELYWSVINETGVTRSLVWLDIRGNHDNMNLPSPEHKHNYYRVYSVQGRQHMHSYSYTHQDGGDRYTFIGIDTCTDPGIKLPFNFVGSLPESELSSLKRIREETRGSNFTIWFGHHPTRSVASNELHELLRLGGPYLCGHYHSALGLFHLGAYTLQETGFLELELVDWRIKRVFRVAAVDHGLFSFVDVRYREWPIILVTNPKSTMSIIPSVEPLWRISRSTHIRVLVFSPEPVPEVRCSIDDGDWRSLKQVGNGSLWVAPWNASAVSGGLHVIKVEAMGSGGGWSKPTEVTFSLDKSQPAPNLITEFVLKSGLSGLRLIFILHVLPCLLLMLWFKAVQTFSWMGPPNLSSECLCCGWLRRPLNLLASVDSLFWPLFCLPLYLCLGPWFVGEMVEGHVGICFIWGVFVYGTYLPPGLSAFYGITYMFLCYLPLLLCVTFTLWRRRRGLLVGAATPLAGVVPLVVALVLQNLWAAIFVLAYGYLALLLGFLTTGTPLLSIVCWHRARTLPYRFLEKYEQFARGTAGSGAAAENPLEANGKASSGGSGAATENPIEANGKASSSGRTSPPLVPSLPPAPPPPQSLP
ncbi:transmembrane protein 62-like [Haemaphysalis longicornis]